MTVNIIVRVNNVLAQDVTTQNVSSHMLGFDTFDNEEYVI